MNEMPREKSFDSTLALLRDPYGFIAKRCQAFGTDLFEARVLLRKTICMTGKEAAKLFYDEDRFTRIDAAPGRVQKTLFGQGGVQGLDGEEHRHRKAMFMSIVTEERVAELARINADCWRAAARQWASMDRVILYQVTQEILTRAVCSWAGVPLRESEVSKRTRELTALFDYAGAVGPKHWWSRLARKRAESWTQEILEQVRAGKLQLAENSATRAIAFHRDLNDDLLPSRIAAVELLNVLRPTVAVSVFITFAALALHQYPECRQKLAEGESGYAELFAQEVRRFYPFFPSVAARVRRDFEWNGYRFRSGARALFDLHGTNHDARLWDVPNEFRPERFMTRKACPFDFVPQGGGDPHMHHRCPGERIAVELLKVAASFLTREITYSVPEQDLGIDTSRLPALPRSHFVIANVRPKF